MESEQTLATVDGVTYVAQTMVYGHRDKDVFFLCPLAEWPSTPEGRLAARDAEIAQLKAELAQLRSQATGPTALPKRLLSDAQIQATAASHSIRWAICPACDTPIKKNNWRRHTAKCMGADQQGQTIMGEQPWPEEAATYPTREAAEEAYLAALGAQALGEPPPPAPVVAPITVAEPAPVAEVSLNGHHPKADALVRVS